MRFSRVVSISRRLACKYVKNALFWISISSLCHTLCMCFCLCVITNMMCCGLCMCACARACECVCRYSCMWTNGCVCACVCLCARVSEHACMCICLYVSYHVLWFVCECVSLCMHASICSHSCMCAYVHMHNWVCKWKQHFLICFMFTSYAAKANFPVYVWHGQKNQKTWHSNVHCCMQTAYLCSWISRRRPESTK